MLPLEMLIRSINARSLEWDYASELFFSNRSKIKFATNFSSTTRQTRILT